MDRLEIDVDPLPKAAEASYGTNNHGNNATQELVTLRKEAAGRCIPALRRGVSWHRKRGWFFLVRAFLLGQAIELYLKAFLLHKGYGQMRLKKEFEHNLKRLLDEASGQGLDLSLHVSPKVMADVEALNKVYKSKALQYFSLLYLLAPPVLPKLLRLFRFADALKRPMGSLLARSGQTTLGR